MNKETITRSTDEKQKDEVKLSLRTHVAYETRVQTGIDSGAIIK